MNEPEAVILVTWINQTDRRITTTDATVKVWASILENIPYDPAVAAVVEHYRLNDEKPPTPKGIRSIAYEMRNRAIAKQAALTAAPATPDRTFNDYVRHMDRPEFRAQMVKGRDVYRAKLRARGITPHNETCTTCGRKES